MTAQRVEKDGLCFDQYKPLLNVGVHHGIFTRHGGVSTGHLASLNLGGNVGDVPEHVRENHRRMFAVLGLPGERAGSVWQVHSARVVLVDRPAYGRRWISAADAMITDQPDVPLTMRFADCAPILFADPVRGAVGIAHAGWRGTVQGVAAATVRAMRRAFDTRPADLLAIIGPSIGPDRFQVGAEVVEAAYRYFGADAGLFTKDPEEMTSYFDLWSAIQLDLQRAGVEKIQIAGVCTILHRDDFFSHRAERGRTGRFGAVISL
jgi:hypothetical protein